MCAEEDGDIVNTHGYQLEGFRHGVEENFQEFKQTRIYFHLIDTTLDDDHKLSTQTFDTSHLEACLTANEGRDRLNIRFNGGIHGEWASDTDPEAYEFVGFYAGRTEGKGEDFRKDPFDKSEGDNWADKLCVWNKTIAIESDEENLEVYGGGNVIDIAGNEKNLKKVKIYNKGGNDEADVIRGVRSAGGLSTDGVDGFFVKFIYEIFNDWGSGRRAAQWEGYIYLDKLLEACPLREEDKTDVLWFKMFSHGNRKYQKTPSVFRDQALEDPCLETDELSFWQSKVFDISLPTAAVPSLYFLFDVD